MATIDANGAAHGRDGQFVAQQRHGDAGDLAPWQANAEHAFRTADVIERLAQCERLDGSKAASELAAATGVLTGGETLRRAMNGGEPGDRIALLKDRRVTTLQGVVGQGQLEWVDVGFDPESLPELDAAALRRVSAAESWLQTVERSNPIALGVLTGKAGDGRRVVTIRDDIDGYEDVVSRHVKGGARVQRAHFRDPWDQLPESMELVG